MTKHPKIKVTTKSFGQNEVLRSELLVHFPQVEFNESGRRFTEEELIDHLKDTDGILLGLEPMTSKVIDALPNLKIIAKFGVGLDNVDVDYAKSQNKVIGWTGGTNKRSVSEQVLAFMIGLARNLYFSGYKLKNANWDKYGGWQLSGKTVGVIGCGNIGTDVLKILQPFDCELLICDILDKSKTAKEYGAIQVSFEELTRRSDFITLHVPLTDQTHYMINEQSLNQMKSNAFLINTSRGPVVEQEAIKKTLKQKKIAGAALDVFEVEPPTDKELLGLPNLMVTPHIGGNSNEAVLAMGRAAISHLKQYFFPDQKK